MFDIFRLLIFLALCFLVGLAGEERTIGFMKSAIISLLLTLLIGIIITLMYPKKKTDYTKMFDEIGKKEEG